MKPVSVLATLILLWSPAAVLAQAAPGSPGSDKARDKKVVVRNVSGTLKATSPDTVVVGGRDKGKEAEWTFGVEPTTDIRKGSKSITARDLKPGEAVHVRFIEQDGKAVARSILVRGKGASGSPAKNLRP